MRSQWHVVASALLLFSLAGTACSIASDASPTPSPGTELSAAHIRYALIDAFGPLSYCDPDEYPISRGDEPERARERLPEIRQDAPTFAAILDRLALSPDGEPDDSETLAIYREWKRLNAVNIEPLADGGFAFELLTETDPGLGRGIRSVGTIDRFGSIELERQEEAFLTGCPICLVRGTLIDTPLGQVAIEDLSAGDPIWTVDALGQRVASTVDHVASVPVSLTHRVVHLVLDDGRELRASPGHPLPDGRTIGELRPGDQLDGATVVIAGLIDYDGRRTYDVLPAGATGHYWADGILLASTLR